MATYKKCRIDQCDVTARYGDICDVHRYRMKKFGSYDQPSRKKYGEICKVEGCETPRNGRHSVCGMHRIRWQRYKSYDVPIIQYPEGIVHTCKIHGELTQETAYKNPKTGHFSCKPCRRESDKRFSDNNPATHYNKYYYFGHEKFRISIDEYNSMVIKQNGLCAICKEPETMKPTHPKSKNKTKRLAIDHSHKTKKIRGLLCHKCNVSLGAFKESIEILESAIAYLKSHE